MPAARVQPHHGHLDRLFAPAAAVADAVCYEGHVLYPYRASATKNQFRWQWGVLVPAPVASEAGERAAVRTELIAEVRAGARIHVRIRGLQVQARTVLALVDGTQVPVPSFDDGEAVWTSFDEAVPWEWDLAPFSADPAVLTTTRAVHLLAGGSMTEPVNDRAGNARAVIARARERVDVRVEMDLTPMGSPVPPAGDEGLVRMGITVVNDTDWSAPGATRDEILRHSTVGTHVLVALDGGRVISSLDPPPEANAAVASCRCDGLYPVLVGDGDRLSLASPIILYDHPVVAPESGGDMFDATEIDEILALRVRTLTDDEKREARGTDVRAAEVLDRCDAMDAAALGSLHGTFRPVEALTAASSNRARSARTAQLEAPPNGLALPRFWEEDAAYDPWRDTVWVGAAELGAGARVRLRPRRHADAQDLFVEGRTATVAGVFHDQEGEVYLAVALDAPDGSAPDGSGPDGSGPDGSIADLQAWHGRYLYFAPEEVEALEPPTAAEQPVRGRASADTADARRRVSKVLVAGVGNVFLGDDGFGVEVVNRIDPCTLPEGVKVADFGIRGVHLAYELLEGYDVVVLIDSVSRGAAPGTLSLIEHTPLDDLTEATLAAMDAHGMDPAAVLAMAADMGAQIGRTLVLGCEVTTLAEGIGLSDPVAAAVPLAIDAVHDLVAGLTGSTADGPTPPLPRPAPPRPVPYSREVSS